jgi:hypothetical protein
VCRGYAYLQEMYYGDADQRLQAYQAIVKLLRPLIEQVPRDQKGWPQQESIYESLVSAHLRVNDIDEAARLTEEGLKHFPENNVLVEDKFVIFVAKLHPDLAVQFGQQLSRGPQRDDTGVIFESALAQFLTKNPEFEYQARRFLYTTTHEYRDYIRMLLYCWLCDQNRPQEAKELLNERWLTIVPETWKDRLQKGDSTVWQEKLIAYYLQKEKVDKEEIFGPLKNRAAFEASPLSRVGLPFSMIYTEAYFYDAMLQSVSGDPATRRQRQLASLQKVLDFKYYPSLEYRMARCLVSQLQAIDRDKTHHQVTLKAKSGGGGAWPTERR